MKLSRLEKPADSDSSPVACSCDVGFEDDPVGRAAVDLLDLEVLLEIAERVDARGRALDLQRVERVALGDAELAADDLVLRQRVAVDVDPLDIDARRFVDDER